MRDSNPSPRCIWGLRSSVVLNTVDWQLLTCRYSPSGPSSSVTLDDGTDRPCPEILVNTNQRCVTSQKSKDLIFSLL
jgi:hypothetical protein